MEKPIPILLMTWNRLEYTKKVFKSLLTSPGCDFEICLVDNFSTDGTREWIYSEVMGKHPNVIVILPPKNLELTNTMNLFFSLYEGRKYFAKVDNDTIMPKNWLKKMLKSMNESNASVIGCLHEMRPELNQLIQNYQGDLVPYKYVGGSGILISGNLLKEYGQLPYFSKMGSWTVYQERAVKDGHKIFFAKDIVAHLLDMEGHGKKNNQFSDYDETIKAMRRL